MIGTTLKHYHVLHALGSGGMGQVYAAEDLTLGRRVALKVLPPEFADDPDRRQRFEREAKAVAALNHPNIVTIYSVEEAGGVHFITMELRVVRVATGEKQLLSKANAVQPSWSPHGHLIAFWRLPLGSSQRDVWTIPASGGTPVPLTSDAALDWNPVWSPDGKHVYFSSDRGGSLNLWRVSISEESGQVLSPPEALTTPTQFVGHLTMSKDATRIAYSAFVLTSNIVKHDFDLAKGLTVGTPVSVTSGSQVRSDPDVSPDGQWLVYRSGVAQEDLFVGRVDGSAAQQLTNDATRDRYPRWSPDGKRIAFYSDRSGQYQIWTINPDGSGAHQLSETPAGASPGYPTWSPDGSRMAGTDPRTFAVWVFNPSLPWKGQTPQPLPTPPGLPAGFIAWSWSPDGTRLAGYARNGIVVYSFTDRAYDTLTSDQGIQPVWLNDGQRLLYSTPSALKLVDTRTKEVRIVLSTERDIIRTFTLSRDSRTIYLARGANEADIWMATLK